MTKQATLIFNSGINRHLAIWLLLPIVFLKVASAQSGFKPLKPIKSYINKLINDTTDISKPQFIAYPTLAFAPETSWEFGLSSLLVYYAKKDTTNRLSEVNGFTFYTLENQYGLWFEHSLYTNKNKWAFIGRLRYQNFPISYFGIGPNSPSQFVARIDSRQLNIKERALRRVGKHIFTGVEIDMQQLSSVRFTQEHGSPDFQKPLGHEGYFNMGTGVGILYDNRHNVLNVREGGFAELAFLHYNKNLGSSHTFSSILSDNRIYKSIGKSNVLAAQIFGQFGIGQPPFNQLSLMGGENLMRGYYAGRYRDRNQLATQVEYRMLPLPLGFTNRLGAAVFCGTGTVFNQFQQLSMKNFVVAGGAGLRYLLFPKKDIYTRVDLSFTREGNGLYIFIGEAF